MKRLRIELEEARESAGKCDPQPQNNEQVSSRSESGLAEWQTTKSMRAREKLRRKVLNGMHELWFYLRRQLGRIRDSATDTVKEQLNIALDDLIDQHQSITVDVEKLGVIGGVKQWLDKESKEANSIVDKRLEKLQNPSDCSSAKKLVCDLSKGCGFGCQIHHVIYCHDDSVRHEANVHRRWSHVVVLQPRLERCVFADEREMPDRWTDVWLAR